LTERIQSLVNPVQPTSPPDTSGQRGEAVGNGHRVVPNATNFQQTLEGMLNASSLKFSAHAQQRLERRQIDLDAQRLSRLEEAVDKAAAKGARESLVLLDDLALVVSVKNRTVITAVDEKSLKEKVFTNIDSAIIV
jgi:flagellar operon protein